MIQDPPLLFSDGDVLNLVDNTGYKITVKKGDVLFGIYKLSLDLISSFDLFSDKLEIIEGEVVSFGLNKYNKVFVDLVVKDNNLDHIKTVTFSQDNSFIGETSQDVLEEFLDPAISFSKTFENILNEKIHDLKLAVENKVKNNRLGNYDEDIWDKVRVGDEIYVLDIENRDTIIEGTYPDPVSIGKIKKITIQNEINDLGFKEVIIDIVPLEHLNSKAGGSTLVALKSASVIAYSIDDVFDGYYTKSLESLNRLNKKVKEINNQLNKLIIKFYE